MSLTSKIKGYFRRLTTPSKDKSYIPDDTSFGDFSVTMVNGTYVDNHCNNIVIEFIYNSDYEDIRRHAEQLLLALESTDIRVLEFRNIATKDDSNVLFYTAGTNIDYIKFIQTLLPYPVWAYNKLFKFLKRRLEELEYVAPYLKYGLDINSYDLDKYNEFVSRPLNLITLTSSNSIKVEDIVLKRFSNILTKDEDDKDLIEKLLPLFRVYVYFPNIDETELYWVNELAYKFLMDPIVHNDLIEYSESMRSNFNIPNFKNILDMNTEVIDPDSMYKDIDEVID
jgi:hypothetical protein